MGRPSYGRKNIGDPILELIFAVIDQARRNACNELLGPFPKEEREEVVKEAREFLAWVGESWA